MSGLYFVALLSSALALVPTGAHLAELASKMQLGASEYLVVQQIYRGWALFGIVTFGALASTCVLTLRLRGYSPAFGPALVALLCLVGTQVLFWAFTFPVNQETDNWTVMPAAWGMLRARWEYSHAAAAVLNVAALGSLIVSVLRRPIVRAPS
ncbi:MAG: hypothetical protein HOP14_14320 [Acidobacteria bacterium]|nr:hypothetical protein [Acidobacteriota bacterium]